MAILRYIRGSFLLLIFSSSLLFSQENIYIQAIDTISTNKELRKKIKKCCFKRNNAFFNWKYVKNKKLQFDICPYTKQLQLFPLQYRYNVKTSLTKQEETEYYDIKSINIQNVKNYATDTLSGYSLFFSNGYKDFLRADLYFFKEQEEKYATSFMPFISILFVFDDNDKITKIYISECAIP